MRFGILSDAHGHWGAFKLAIARLQDLGCERLYYLGDSVGYIPSGRAVRHLRENRHIKAIKGNHETMLLGGTSTEEQNSVYKFHDTAKSLSVEDWSYLQSLPDQLDEHLDGFRCCFVHGSPVDPQNGYIYPDSDLDSLVMGEWQVIFMGHTHRAFIRSFKNKTFVNVGSCGLPRDSSLGSACTFDTATGQAKIIRFNIGKSAKRILERNLVHPSVAKYLEKYTEVQDVTV